MANQTINLNFTPANFQPCLYFSQGDVGRVFQINLLGIEIPSGATVTMQGTKPSGFGFTVEADSVNDGVALFTSTETMTAEAGRFPAELHIEYDSVKVGMANFLMVGEKNPHPNTTIDGDAEEVIPQLTLLVKRVETAASKVLDMEVEAQTLPAGSAATYSYNEEENKVTFGIPEGQAGSGAVGTVASAYSATKTYAVGDYAIQNGNLYRCTTAITTAESFTAAHWTQVVLGDDVSDLKSDLKSAIAIYGGNNLLNYATFTDGKFRNAQDGSFPSNPNYCYSSPIYVKPNTTYKLSTAYHTCFLDVDKNFISGVWVNTSFVTPSNCYFVQVSPPIADKSTATLYEVERGDSDSKMFSGNSKNLLTNTVWEDQYAYIYNTGDRTYNASYSNSGLINVGGGTPIYLHNVNNPHTVFYDKDGKYISGKLDSYFATPSNCVYMRISIYTSDKANALVIRYDREDKIKVGTESDMVPRLNFAHALAQLCNLPIYVYGGEYDIGALFGGYGFNPVNDVIGIGMPKLYVNKSAFDVNLSCFMLNRANKSITIDGFRLEVTNGRYCVHDEEGGLSSGQYYTHKIKNCVMKQNTEIQQDFTYPRCIGIGLGNNGHIVIENCYLESNVPEEIDAHTGYKGQTQNATVFIKDCIMPTGTVSLTDAGVGSGFVDTMVVTNCLVNAEPTASDNAKLKMVKYNNTVVQ